MNVQERLRRSLGIGEEGNKARPTIRERLCNTLALSNKAGRGKTPFRQFNLQGQLPRGWSTNPDIRWFAQALWEVIRLPDAHAEKLWTLWWLSRLSFRCYCKSGRLSGDGPAPVASPSRARYYVTWIDDHTRYTWIYFITHKSDAMLRQLNSFLYMRWYQHKACMYKVFMEPVRSSKKELINLGFLFYIFARASRTRCFFFKSSTTSRSRGRASFSSTRRRLGHCPAGNE